MKTRTRGNQSAQKDAGKAADPVVIKVRKMRGGKAHILDENAEEMISLTLQQTIEER